jgi:2-C-methyl-D-erythritol 4-phosphate cytidylyltransferase
LGKLLILGGVPALPEKVSDNGTMFTVQTHEFQPRCFALVPCAGVGERAGVGGPKQYHPVAGRPVVAHTLAALSAVARIDAIVVVLAPGDVLFAQHMPGFEDARHRVAPVGGATRADSVANGLLALLEQGAQPHDWVLVHDAARCLLQPAAVNRLIDACEGDEVGGLLALPLADTLKAAQRDASGAARACATLDRQDKWAAQTPQMFRLGLLQAALAHALSDPVLAAGITDEASAIEALGHQPKLVPGAIDNIKLTWPDDFAWAERWLKQAAP